MAFSTNNTAAPFSFAPNMTFFTDISSSTRAFPSIIINLLIALSSLTLAIHMLRPKKRGGGSCPLPPGPKPLPLIGCLHLMVVNKPAFQWIHNMMEKMNTGIACIRLGKAYVIAVTSPELAQEFLQGQDAIFASRPAHMSTELPTSGYLTTALTPHGTQWKKMRRVVISEVLSLQRHRWLQAKRFQEADHLTRHVYNLCCTGGGIVNVRAVTQHYCGNVIRKLMFNKRFFGNGMADGGPGPEEIEHVDGLFKVLADSNGAPLLAPLVAVLSTVHHQMPTQFLQFRETVSFAGVLSTGHHQMPTQFLQFRETVSIVEEI